MKDIINSAVQFFILNLQKKDYNFTINDWIKIHYFESKHCLSDLYDLDKNNKKNYNYYVISMINVTLQKLKKKN